MCQEWQPSWWLQSHGYSSVGLLLSFDKGFYDSWLSNCNRSVRVLAPNIFDKGPDVVAH